MATDDTPALGTPAGSASPAMHRWTAEPVHTLFGSEGSGFAAVSKWSGARAHRREARPKLSALLERIDAHPRAEPLFARHRQVSQQ